MRNHFLSRCFVPPDRWSEDGLLTPDPEESRHLGRVLHARPGDRVEAFDGMGRRAACEIRETGLAMKLVAKEISREPPPQNEIRLIVGMPKENKLEWLLQKGTELGMTALTLFTADRSVVRLAPNAADRRLPRWERIVRDAAKQSGRCRMPRLDLVENLAAALRVAPDPDAIRLICALDAPPGSLRSEIAQARSRGIRTWSLFIGPEGDFSPDEVTALRDAGARAVSLGARVLRVETAGLFALSALLYELET